MQTATETLQMALQDVEERPTRADYDDIRLLTSRGTVTGRLYRAPGATSAVIWAGGAGGGWDTPARGLYPQLSNRLRDQGITSLRLRYRCPGTLMESVLDVLTGIAYLDGAGITRVALVGHSFGGAVVIQAAAVAPSVCTVVTLATQSYGAAAAARLAPRCSLLLLHGKADRVLAPTCSMYVHGIAGEPKRLKIYGGAEHGLDEAAEQVHGQVADWLIEHLALPHA